MDQNKEISGICCEVQNCKYHDKANHCHAGRIQVGHTYAKNTDETVCETFIPCKDCCQE